MRGLCWTVLAALFLSGCRGDPSSAVRLSDRYRLGGDGIGNIRFGEAPETVAAGLERIFGRPSSASEASSIGYFRLGCGFDEIIWAGLAERSNGSNSAGLTVYFKHSRFVGYSYGPPYGGRLAPGVRSGPMLSTSSGLGLDETLAHGRRLYGRAFVVTSRAQGTPPNPPLERLPAWEVRTVSGRIYGFLDSPGGPRSTYQRTIGSISAGAIPNTPCGAPAPPADAIVFDLAASDSLDARIEIAYVPAGGGAVVSLTAAWKDGMVAAEPRWSPDGSRIVFVMSPRGHLTRYAGDGDIYVMNADGTSARRLTDGLDASSAAWSPDGSRIAFVKGQGQALAVMSADGADRRMIAQTRGYYEGPAWSPDGHAIAYQSSPGRDKNVTAIFTIRPDGTGERQLTPRSASAGFAAWSPDGSRIAYSSSDRLWVMSSDGTKAHPVTRCRLPCAYDFAPAWSPTGRDLVFVRQEDGGGARRLYVLELSTDAVRPVTPEIRWSGSPDWRRGGDAKAPRVTAFLAGSRLERPDALLSRLPFMAVACHTPNSIACDRVGLAVWLRHPALSISATIAGAPLQLNNAHWSGPARHGRRWMFAGFLHPAGIGTRLNLTNDPNSTTWLPPSNVPLGPDTSSYAPEPVVQLRIQVAPGRTVATRLHVPLGDGWG